MTALPRLHQRTVPHDTSFNTCNCAGVNLVANGARAHSDARYQHAPDPKAGSLRGILNLVPGFLDLIAPSPTSPTPLQAREKGSHLLQRIFFGNARRSHDRTRWCLIEASSSMLRLGLQIFNNLLELAVLQGGSREHLLAVCRHNIRAHFFPHAGVDLLHGWRCTFRYGRGREKHLDCGKPPCKKHKPAPRRREHGLDKLVLGCLVLLEIPGLHIGRLATCGHPKQATERSTDPLTRHRCTAPCPPLVLSFDESESFLREKVSFINENTPRGYRNKKHSEAG
jgi:hypothetical protein